MSNRTEPTIGGDPSASPDYLAPPTSRGMGVRRLNRVPLFIVGALILIVVAAISYTYFQRLAQQRAIARAQLDAGNVKSLATAPFSPEAAGPPKPPELPTDTTPSADVNQTPIVPAPLPQPDPDMDARLRLIRRVEENKFAANEAALGAEAGVQSFAARRNGNGAAPPPGNTLGQLPNQMAGIDNAAQLASSTEMSGLGGAGFYGAGQPSDPNRQDHKRNFLSSKPELDTYLNHTRTAPIAAALEVKAGTIIPGVMIGGVNSDLPGQIIGQVRENVYDSATGQNLLIPAGARLVGTYDSTVTTGQRRALVAWRRIIYPDGSSVSLDLMPGADTSGYAGFSDKVDNHYWRIFGNAFMLSLFSAGIQLSQPDSGNQFGGYDSQQILAAELGRQLGQLGMEMTRRNLDIQPTLEIRPGYRFVVMVTKDMVLPPWQGHPLARQN